jgi:ATP adenylyltransferase
MSPVRRARPRSTRATARPAAPRTRSTAPSRAAGLERLWAPWRMTWLRQASAPSGCLFCRVSKSRDDRRDLVLARRPDAILMLNRYPYASAHLMVAVRRHAGRFLELKDAERTDVLDLTSLAERLLEVEDQPAGVNYGLNVGRVAGAGFPGHLHLHLVPRWEGDTNFMPAIAQTRVLPESLLDTWQRLRRALAQLERPARTRARATPRKRGARGA